MEAFLSWPLPFKGYYGTWQKTKKNRYVANKGSSSHAVNYTIKKMCQYSIGSAFCYVIRQNQLSLHQFPSDTVTRNHIHFLRLQKSCFYLSTVFGNGIIIAREDTAHSFHYTKRVGNVSLLSVHKQKPKLNQT